MSVFFLPGQTAVCLSAGQTAVCLSVCQTAVCLGVGQTAVCLSAGQTAVCLGAGQTAVCLGVGQTARLIDTRLPIGNAPSDVLQNMLADSYGYLPFSDLSGGRGGLPPQRSVRP